MSLEAALNPPFLTADLPGVGGVLKQSAADFEVEEVPAYEPSGSGEHLYLWVEKEGVGGEYLLKFVGRILGVSPRDIGAAGIKDRHAVTRQYLSVPANCEPKLPRLEEEGAAEGVRLLRVARHTNKLKAGHLRGNRFTIRVRGADATKFDALPEYQKRFASRGVPNFYGPQRFGHGGETAHAGLALLRREPIPANERGHVMDVRAPFRKKLALSAAQSVFFNAYLAARLDDGLLHTVLPGDALAKWPAGGMFVSDEPAVDQPRLDAHEVVPAGPMFGKKTFAVRGAAAEREQAIFDAFALTPELFQGHGSLLEGTRRHNLIYLDDFGIEVANNDLVCRFTLPAGCYATVVLRELMKSDDTEGGGDSA